VKTFGISPLEGVGPVRFGMTRDEVHAALGTPETVDDGREWFLDGFAVDFDSSGKVELLEFAASEQFRVLFHDQCIHELAADDAVALVSQHAIYDANDPELGYTYMFPKLQLSLWRPTTEEPHFHAVAIGRDGYFDS
jgi:hypothetical protein